MNKILLFAFTIVACGNGFAQSCSYPVIIESKSSYQPGTKNGFEEFGHDDLPKIRYYLHKLTKLEWSSSGTWADSNEDNHWEPQQNGSHWSTDSSLEGSSSETINVTMTERMDACSGAIGIEYAGSHTKSSHESHSGLYTIYGNEAYPAETEQASYEKIAYQLEESVSTDEATGRLHWQGVYTDTYEITYVDPPADPTHGFAPPSTTVTYSDYFQDELETTMPGDVVIESPVKMTITANPPPYGGQNKTTITLSAENATDMFIDCIRKSMPEYGEEWFVGRENAGVKVNAAENQTVGNARKFKFRFRIRNTEAESQYRVKWREVVKTANGFAESRLNEALVSGSGVETISQDFEVDVPSNDQEIQIFGVKAELDNGCRSCNGISSPTRVSIPGVGAFDGHGINVRIGLGQGRYGESAGDIIVSLVEPSKKLRPADVLSVSSARGDVSISRITTNGVTWITSVSTPLVGVGIESLRNDEILKFHFTNQLTGRWFKTWDITAAEGPAPTNYVVREIEAAETRSWLYNYSGSRGNSEWELIHPEVLKVEKFITLCSSNLAANTITTIETHKVLSPSSQVLLSESTTYQLQHTDGTTWREVLLSDSTGAGGNEKTSTYAYYDYQSAYGETDMPVQTVRYSDSTWKWVANYGDSTILPVNEYFPTQNEDPDEVTPSRHRYRLTGYTSMDSEVDDLSVASWHPRSQVTTLPDPENPLTTFWSGTTVYVFAPNLRREITYLSEDGSQSLETVYRFENDQRLRSIKYPDGTLFIQFFSTNGTDKVWKTQKGQANLTETGVVDGVETETKRNLLGYPVYILNKDIASGIITSREDYSYPDEFGRPQLITYLDGSSRQLSYDCCSLATMVDPDKVLMQYTRDILRRVNSESRLGITVTNVLDALGRPLVTTRLAGTNYSFLSAVSYDSNGELRYETNALGGVIEHYDFFIDGYFVKRTTNHVSGAVRDEIYNKAGNLVEISGVGANPRRYYYAVENNSDLTDLYGKQYILETRLTATGGTNEWVKTYYDFAGQPFRKVFSAPPETPNPQHTYVHNDKGQLVSETDPDGVTKLYSYNQRGELEYSGIDMSSGGSRNGILDLNGYDRVTRTVVSFYTNSFNLPVRGEGTYLWLTNGSSTSTLVRLIETSVFGSNAWQVIPNGATSVITRIERTTADFAGTRYEKITYPDGSTSTENFIVGRLIARTRRLPDTTLIQGLTFGYDVFGRQSSVTDARNGTAFFDFGAGDLVTNSVSPFPFVGGSAQTTSYLYDALGRLIRVTEPDNTWRTNIYYPDGRPQKTFGTRTYPVAYEYDAQGRVSIMSTWQSSSSELTRADTTWVYNEYSGRPETKTYAGSAGPTYHYTPGGRLAERLWVRTVAGNPVTTAYTYTDAGDLYQTSYSDGTASVVQSYDRAGRLVTVAQDGTTTFGYNELGMLLSEAYSGGTLGSRTVSHAYNNGVLLRTNMVMSTDAATEIGYQYDSASRLTNVVSGVFSAGYNYQPNSSLLNQTISRHNGTNRLVVTRSYDYLNRLQQITSAPGAPDQLPWSYVYTYNEVNQRTDVALADGSKWQYGYDALGQVTSSKHKWADGTYVAGQQFEYSYDEIGNRTSSKRGGDSNGANLRVSDYTGNLKNQYEERTVPGYADILGVAVGSASVQVNGSSSGVERKGQYFRKELTVSNSSSAQYPSVTVQAISGTNSSPTESGNLFVPKSPEICTYDEDGNLKRDGRWDYTWDAENRLVKLESIPGAPSGSARRLEFKYDFYGRRIYKKETDLGSAAVLTEQAFVYDGGNIYAELSASGSLTRSFLWGEDMSYNGAAAGGVGGLLAMKPAAASAHFYAYDGSGNVCGLADGTTGSVSARYEYGGFGEVIAEVGFIAKSNPFRWSTKFKDETSDLGSYQFRYYSPAIGKWLNRDVLGEFGGANLYAFVNNAPTVAFDVNGQWPASLTSWFDPPYSGPTYLGPNPGDQPSYGPTAGSAARELDDYASNLSESSVPTASSGRSSSWESGAEDARRFEDELGRELVASAIGQTAPIGEGLGILARSFPKCRLWGKLTKKVPIPHHPTSYQFPRALGLAHNLPPYNYLKPIDGFTDFYIHAEKKTGFQFRDVTGMDFILPPDYVADVIKGSGIKGNIRLISCEAGICPTMQKLVDLLGDRQFLAATVPIKTPPVSPVMPVEPWFKKKGEWLLFSPGKQPVRYGQ
jgi:RHS repeat-associated protein